MENTDNLYHRTIGKIREMQPVLEHPEKLSRRIMEHITPPLPKPAAIGNRLSGVRIACGVAAILVTGLFVYECMKPLSLPPEASCIEITGRPGGSLGPAIPIPEKIKRYAASRQIQQVKKQQREEFCFHFRMSNVKKQNHEK